jgi:hypothetical protein
MIEMSAETAELFKALVAFQAECPSPVKTSTNPHFKSKFSPLDEVLDTVKPYLSKHGLTLNQFPCGATSGMVGVATQVGHVSGQWMRCHFSLGITKNDPQMACSGISYARRYAVLAALNLAAEDDDGESATRPKPEPKQSTASRLDAIAAGGERADRPLATGQTIQRQSPSSRQSAATNTDRSKVRGGDPVPVSQAVAEVAYDQRAGEVIKQAEDAGFTVERVMSAPVRPKGEEPVLTFGKYKGKLVLDETIPAGYYRWFAQQSDYARSPIREWIDYALADHEWQKGEG